MERLRVATILPAEPATIYDCWLSGKRHTEMTGASAVSEAKKGGAFTAWDGYISGTHLVLERGKRIVQSWRTTEFPSASPDSVVEIRLSKVSQGTKLSLLQSDIPDGQSDQYAEAWLKFYFDPMTLYFEKDGKSPPKKATRVKAKAPRPKRAKKNEPAARKSEARSPKKVPPNAAAKQKKKAPKKKAAPKRKRVAD